MTDFTIEANLYGQIKDKPTQKAVKDWGGDVSGFESEVTVLVRKLSKLAVTTRQVVRKCEDRLKEKDLDKKEKDALEDVIKQAEGLDKKFRALEAFD